MSPLNLDGLDSGPAGKAAPPVERDDEVLAATAWHSLAWLAAGNAVGLLMGALLLFPKLNSCLGELTYGRWAPLHLNLNLYGWCSLPMVAWLFHVYQADRRPVSAWARAALWAWSAALTAGALSWLSGRSGGKLFLEWRGYARVLWLLAMLFLWSVLAWSFRTHWGDAENASRARRAAKLCGLATLLAVPFTLYWAAGPNFYPPVNPDTGGPTGASLLESTLGVIFIWLALPFGFAGRKPGRYRIIAGARILFAAECVVSLALGRGNTSHHERGEILGLGSLLLWAPLLAAYFNAFEWRPETRRWRNACFIWWAMLVITAWAMFLPGLLDRVKFTNALVGHAHMAMAGFVSSLDIYLLVALLGERGRGFNSRWAFFAWNAGAFSYTGLMFLAGWLEAIDPSFAFVPGASRDAIYSLRLVCGGVMAAAAVHWWRELSRSMAERLPVAREETPAEAIASGFAAVESR